MDPASAILSFLGASVQLIRLVKDTLDGIKNAPKELQLLQDRVADIELLLEQLKQRKIEELFHSREDWEGLDRLRRRAQQCLDEIAVFVVKVQTISAKGGKKVDKLKWLLHGRSLSNLSSQLDRLETTLNLIMNLVVS